MVVDSGCRAHIINDDTKFVDFDKNFKPEEHFVILAEGTTQKGIAEKRGTAPVHMKDEDGKIH